MQSFLLSFISILALNSYAQNVNIPDANFKAYLVGNTLINTNGDAEIQVSEATAFAGDIDCVNSSISDLTGLEAFTALTYLGCSYNNITSLDMSNNIALEYLYCGPNQLTSLDVSYNTALTGLNCGNNQLTSLDVSNNSALTQLFCYNNQLTSLDVSQNTALTDLNCGNNQLTSLDVSNNSALIELWGSGNQLTSLDVSSNTALELLACYSNQLICLNVKNGNNLNFIVSAFLGAGLNATQNPNLTCIEVDDVAWSNANWTNIDASSSFSTSCLNPCTVGVEELSNTPKQLLKIVDLMGRETPYKPNIVLIYVYSDGSAEKVFKMEE